MNRPLVVLLAASFVLALVPAALAHAGGEAFIQVPRDQVAGGN